MSKILSKDKVQLGIIILSIILALSIIVALFVLNSNDNEYSLEIETPELIDDCWVTVNGKKATEANLKIGQKIEIDFGCSPDSGKNTKMLVTLDDKYANILSVKNHTVTALDGGKASVDIEILFPGRMGGKATITLPITVKSKSPKKEEKPTASQSSKPQNISSSSTSSAQTSSVASKPTHKDNNCPACGEGLEKEPFNHELLECLNHRRCEIDKDKSEEALHVMAPCGDHLLCDGKNHELRSCFRHYECDKEFTLLPCGHCSCEHNADQPCE